MLLWCGHGCSAKRMLWNMDVIMVWAWMLWSSYALEHGCYYGFGMDALVNVCMKSLRERKFAENPRAPTTRQVRVEGLGFTGSRLRLLHTSSSRL